MGRPRLFDEPLTPAERMRRYRRRKRLLDVKPVTYRPLEAVTEPVAKPWRFRFDATAMIG